LEALASLLFGDVATSMFRAGLHFVLDGLLQTVQYTAQGTLMVSVPSVMYFPLSCITGHAHQVT